jgi:hypothetical protein
MGAMDYISPMLPTSLQHLTHAPVARHREARKIVMRCVAVVVGLGLSACAQGYPWSAILPAAATDAGTVFDFGDASTPPAGNTGTDNGTTGPTGMASPGSGLFKDCVSPAKCLPSPSCMGEQKGNAYYFFCGASSTWDEARATCKTIPGTDLAYIEDKEEGDFIASKVGRDMWLGGKRAAGTWSWPDGTEFWSGDAATGMAPNGAYVSWVADHPNTAGDCLLFFSARKAWAAAGCALKFGFVCKREQDLCPDDNNKMAPGTCGCGKPDSDSDGDKVADCKDECPDDPNHAKLGDCGCIGEPDPAPAGTACADGMCAANTECDGKGSCGTPEECCTKATCGPMDCGSKPDGCGGMLSCTFVCPAGAACGPDNTCGCSVASCPLCTAGLNPSACCLPDDTCGCRRNTNRSCE